MVVFVEVPVVHNEMLDMLAISCRASSASFATPTLGVGVAWSALVSIPKRSAQHWCSLVLPSAAAHQPATAGFRNAQRTWRRVARRDGERFDHAAPPAAQPAGVRRDGLHHARRRQLAHRRAVRVAQDGCEGPQRLALRRSGDGWGRVLEGGGGMRVRMQRTTCPPQIKPHYSTATTSHTQVPAALLRGATPAPQCNPTTHSAGQGFRNRFLRPPQERPAGNTPGGIAAASMKKRHQRNPPGA